MMRANRYTLAKLCLLAALAVPAQRAASATVSQGTPQANAVQLLAQGNAEFTLPDSLDDAETLLIDGSSSMRTMNAALTAQFQERYESAAVEAEANGSDVAIDRLLNGEIDLAALGRPLTVAEQDAGLSAVAIAREKIAIIVGPDNPFDGDITFQQFGQIFRGEITDWSELGGEPGPIRFVDRPEFSDTRRAFRPYPVFQEAEFVTGFTADPVGVDETDAVIDALGTDGIGYAIANQVSSSDDVKIISMHKTLPDNPAYPFSQPRNYVYLGEPTAAAAGFLGVATGEEGQSVVAKVRDAEEAAAVDLKGERPTATSPDGTLIAATGEDNVAFIENDLGEAVTGPLLGAGGAVTALAFSGDGQTLATGTSTGNVRYWDVDGTPKSEAFAAGNGKTITDLEFEGDDKLLVSATGGQQGYWGPNGLPFGETAATGAVAGAADGGAAAAGKLPPWLWLIPLLGLLGAGLWALLGRKKSDRQAEAIRQTAPTATVPPPVTDPETEREVSNRAQSVISTDRVTDESRVIIPGEPVVAPDAAVSAQLPVGLPGLNESGPTNTADTSETTLPLYESTDLESPDLEGTNLDLLTPTGALGGAAALAGGAALGGMMMGGLDAGVESDDDDDEEWDDNLDLTLDDAPLDDPPQTSARGSVLETDASTTDVSITDVSTTGVFTGSIPDTEISDADASTTDASITDVSSDSTSDTDVLASDLWASDTSADDSVSAADASEADTLDTDLWTSTADTSVPGTPVVTDLDNLEPTRGTVIAETETILDIEPTRETIIGDSAVIFGEAAATTETAQAADVHRSAAAPSTGFGVTTEVGDRTSSDSAVVDSAEPTNHLLSNDVPDVSPIAASAISGGTMLALSDLESSDSEESELNLSESGLSESGLSDLDSSESGLSGLDSSESGLSGLDSSDSGSSGLDFSESGSSGLDSSDSGSSGLDSSDSGSSGLDSSDSGSSTPDSSTPDSSDSERVDVDSAMAAGIAGAAGIAAVGLAAGAPAADAATSTISTSPTGEKASATDVHNTNPSITSTEMEDVSALSIEELATVDDGLPDLPEGYGESRIVLLPRDPKWAYAYWDVSNEHKEELRQQGGQRLMLRLYDVTDIDQSVQAPHSMQQQDCHEMARSWYLEVPVSDRDYSAEIGYLTADDRWLLLSRSAPIRVPPIYPSDWVKDQFVTIGFDEGLEGRTFGDLGQPYSPEIASDSEAENLPKIYDDLFALTQSQEALRVAGSVYGSMQHAAPGALSPSGNVSGQPGVTLNASGLNMSGLNMSGVGPDMAGRVRNFWLVADAELIVYGATEPSATLTVGDRVVPLNPDGTFRFHVSFPDGQIDYPIRAVAADGEQTRSIHLHFERETPERNTNTKADAKDEWF